MERGERIEGNDREQKGTDEKGSGERERTCANKLELRRS